MKKMQNKVITGSLWAAAIAAAAYLMKGQEFTAMLIIIMLVLAVSNITLIKEVK